MNGFIFPCAIATLLFSATGFAFAQSTATAQAPGVEVPTAAPENAKVPFGQRGNPQDQRRQMDHPGSPPADSSSRKEAGVGPNHDLYKGGKLPAEYHNKPQNVVNDWRLHHLSPPPRGHHWVQVGYVYVLVAITTGVIVKIQTVK